MNGPKNVTANFSTTTLSFTDVTTARMPTDSDNSEAGHLGDVDGDGDLDFFIANRSVQNRLLINDGSGNYTDGTVTRLPADSDFNTGVDFGDRLEKTRIPDAQPRRLAGHELADGLGCLLVTELPGDLARDNNLSEQLREELGLADKDQILNGRTVRDNQHQSSSPKTWSSVCRSASRSSGV